MRKTSVYLSDDLKLGLARTALRSGRSEADVIRTAIERVVGTVDDEAARQVAPEATALARRRPTGPLLIGVGVGPGNPDLLTTRAAQAIATADRVIAGSTGPDAVGRAELIVRAAVPTARVERALIAITPDDTARRASIEAVAEQLIEHLDAHEVVAFIMLGDPNMFSVFPAIADIVRSRRPQIGIETVPGVMAFQELAARSGTVIADEGDSVRIIACGSDIDRYAQRIGNSLAERHETLVMYRGGRHLPALADEIERHDRATGTVVGELLGLPGEHCAPLDEVRDRPASYLATIIAPAGGRG